MLLMARASWTHVYLTAERCKYHCCFFVTFALASVKRKTVHFFSNEESALAASKRSTVSENSTLQYVSETNGMKGRSLVQLYRWTSSDELSTVRDIVRDTRQVEEDANELFSPVLLLLSLLCDFREGLSCVSGLEAFCFG